MDAVRDLAQLLERSLTLSQRVVERCGESVVAVRCGSRAGETQVVDEREQSLLRAVVQVALEQPPCGVAGLDDARAGRPQVVELVEQLGLQALVLDREARGGADVARQVLLGDRAASVHDDCDAAVPAHDPRHGAIGARAREPGGRRRR